MDFRCSLFVRSSIFHPFFFFSRTSAHHFYILVVSFLKIHRRRRVFFHFSFYFHPWNKPRRIGKEEGRKYGTRMRETLCTSMNIKYADVYSKLAKLYVVLSIKKPFTRLSAKGRGDRGGDSWIKRSTSRTKNCCFIFRNLLKRRRE